MSNPLTGDYEAVLQVSGKTVNRLMASLHQNAGLKPKLPSHPHSVSFRIGDSYPLDGVRGWMDAQLGVPRIRLLHGVSDRFDLEVDVRSRFRGDPGSSKIPEFIHGKVYARYRFQDIEPSCPGWGKNPRDYLWIRVIKNSVRFEGSAVDELSLQNLVEIVDEDKINKRITRQIAYLLATRFEAPPQKVDRRFRAGSMRSLATDEGSAIAIPIALKGGSPVGQISSIGNIILGGSDFAVGIDIRVILDHAAPMVAEIGGFTKTFDTKVSPFIGKDFHVYSTARVTSATAAWEASGGDSAVLRISVTGRVDSDSSWAPDITFSVNLPIFVYFDASADALVFAAGDPGVHVRTSGLLSTQSLANRVHAGIKTAVKQQTQDIPSVPVGSGRSELVSQLHRLDDVSDAHFEYAEFSQDGIVLRGRIQVAPRRKPNTNFHMTAEKDGFSAFGSWMPGGRIDKFTWSWKYGLSGAGDSSTRKDRYVLRRPLGAKTKWGLITTSKPLPGVDDIGRICLAISGRYIDPETGAQVPFESHTECTRFGPNLGITNDIGRPRLLEKVWPEYEIPGRPRPRTEIGLVDIGGQSVRNGVNTLIVYVGDEFDSDTAEVLAKSLNDSKRDDAGLMLMALFRDGALDGRRGEIVDQVEAFANRVGVLSRVVEDVGGAWTKRFAISPDDQAWRLLTPSGGLTWMHDGRASARAFTKALDVHLRESRSPVFTPIESRFSVGDVLGPFLPVPGADRSERKCPPIRISFRPGRTKFVFAQAAAVSSTIQLSTVEQQTNGCAVDEMQVIAVVDGPQAEADALAEKHPSFVVLPDSGGELARMFGIRMWPTTIELDENGLITTLEQGIEVRGTERVSDNGHFSDQGSDTGIHSEQVSDAAYAEGDLS